MPRSSGRANRALPNATAPSPDRVLLSDYPFDGFEIGILKITRLFLMAAQVPKSQSWQDAFRYADTHFGPDKGPMIAKAVLDVTNALRATRTSAIRFHTPYCRNCSAHVTREESHLISTLYCLRRKTPNARSHAMMLCEGADDTAFFDKMNTLISRADYLDPRAAEAHHTRYQ